MLLSCRCSYRNLLNAWKMWNQRAQFDIAMRSSTNEKPPQQIYISCNFCGKSISSLMQGLSRARGPFGRLGSTSNKLKVGFHSHMTHWSKYNISFCQFHFNFRCHLVRTVANLYHAVQYA